MGRFAVLPFRWKKRPPETFEELRAQMVQETSDYVTFCLQHPEHAVRIPTAPADRAKFPPSLTPAFWDAVLFDR